MIERDAQRSVHDACMRMVADGLVIGSAGNVSIRLDDHRIVVSAGGVPYHELVAGDHPVVNLADSSWIGPRAPTSELHVHVALMRARPDIGAVVHTHSRHAAAHAVARVDLEWICNENIGPRSERILVTNPYAPPGSVELAEAAVATLQRQPGSRACLLANHGPVTIAHDLATAYLIAQQVEWIAAISVGAATLGGAHVLDRDEQDAIAHTYGFRVARDPTSTHTSIPTRRQDLS